MWTKMSREIGWDGTFNPSKAVHSIVHCLKQQPHSHTKDYHTTARRKGGYCTKETRAAGRVKAQDAQKADHVKSQAPVRSRGTEAGVRNLKNVCTQDRPGRSAFSWGWVGVSSAGRENTHPSIWWDVFASRTSVRETVLDEQKPPLSIHRWTTFTY